MVIMFYLFLTVVQVKLFVRRDDQQSFPGRRHCQGQGSQDRARQPRLPERSDILLSKKV